MQHSIDDITNEYNMKWESGILFHRDKKICNFSPIVTGRYPETEPGKREYQMTICVGDGKETMECTASLKVISNAEFWRDLSDNCIIFPGVSDKNLTDCMRCIIQAQIYEGVPERERIDSLGWHEHGEHTYYCAGNIVYSSPAALAMEVSETIASEYQIAPHNDKDAMELFGELKEMLSLGSPIAVTCWLCDIVAKLYTVFKWCKIYIEFSVMIVGDTSSYKTTLARYFAHMYGSDKDIGGMMAELSATKGALEIDMEKCKDCEFLIDDLAPTVRKRTAKEKAEVVSTLIRQATSSADAIKRQGNKVRKNHVEGILVFTSEESINISSIVNRVILLNTDQFPIGEEMLRFIERNPSFPVELSLLIIKDIVWDIREYKSLLTEKFSLHMNEECVARRFSRFRKNYMCLRTAWDLVQKVAEKKGVDLSGEANIHIQNAMNKIMSDHADKLEHLNFHKDQYAPVRILFHAILNRENKDIFDTSFEGEIEYEKKKDYIYLLPDEARRYLLRETGQEYTTKSLSLLLDTVGALQKDMSGVSTKKYHGQRYWVLDQEIVEEFMERGN